MTVDDLMELVHLAAYLENKAARGLFPKARFKRYSDALDELFYYLAHGDDEDDDEQHDDNVIKFRPHHRPGGGRL
jgi:hypothetical protein